MNLPKWAHKYNVEQSSRIVTTKRRNNHKEWIRRINKMKWSREFKRHREAQCFETGRIAIKRTWSKLKYQTDEKKNEIHLRYVYSCTCNICVIEKNKNGYTKTDSRWPWADMSERYENIRINTDIYILFVVCDVSFLLCGGRQVCWVWAARLLPRQILIFFLIFHACDLRLD